MNTTKKRPSLRELFFVSNKRINIVFHTSNTSKYLQARAVFSRFGLYVDHFRGHTEPYSEEYDEGKETLLENAIKEVLLTLGRNSVFFVEDTSLSLYMNTSAFAGSNPSISVALLFFSLMMVASIPIIVIGILKPHDMNYDLRTFLTLVTTVGVGTLVLIVADAPFCMVNCAIIAGFLYLIAMTTIISIIVVTSFPKPRR